MSEMSLRLLEEALELLTGETIQSLRDTPVDEHRAMVEKRAGARMEFVSDFDLIGRGNVLRDRLVTAEEAEREAVAALAR